MFLTLIDTSITWETGEKFSTYDLNFSNRIIFLIWKFNEAWTFFVYKFLIITV